MTPELLAYVGNDPVRFSQVLWPHVKFYDKQVEIIESIQQDYETFVPAGNMLGKDFIAGFIALSFFIRPQLYFSEDYVREVESRKSPTNPFPHTTRVVTTSVKDDHLRVLWGEIGRYIDNSRFPLQYKNGGPLIVHHRDIRKIFHDKQCKVSYLRGMVSEKGEGLAGHHAAYTLMIGDEASGLDDLAYTQAGTWAKRQLYIGNPNPTDNFFKKYVEEGSLPITSDTPIILNTQ